MSRNQKYLFWSIVVLMHFLFFLWSITEKPMLRDSSEYLFSARNWGLHHSFYCFDWEAPTDFRGFTKRPPLYPLFLYFSGATKGFYWVALLLQNLLSLFNIALCIRIFNALAGPAHPSSGKVILFTLSIIFSLSQLVYANLLMAEILFQTIVLLFISSCIQLLKSNHLKNWMIASVLVTAGFLTKPVFVFWVYLLPFFWIIVQLRLRSFRLKHLWGLMPALTPILMLHLYSDYNRKTTGYYHLSSITEINLLHYNTRYTLLKIFGADKTDSLLAPLMIIPETKEEFAQNSKKIRETCSHLLLQHRTTYFQIHTLGMIRMLIDPGRFDLYSFFKLDRSDKNGLMEKSLSDNNVVINYFRTQSLAIVTILLVILIFNVLKLYFFIRLMLLKSIPIAFRLLLFSTIAYFVLLTGPLGASRFLVPVLPLLFCAVLFYPRTKVSAESHS